MAVRAKPPISVHSRERVQRPHAQLRILQLADYGGPYAGSFVPMLRAISEQAARRGHRTQVVFTAVARDRPWLAELAGEQISFAGRDLRKTVAAVLEATSEPVILHSHFTSFDVPAVLAARRRRNTHVIWHLHSGLHGELRVRAANAVKFGIFGRAVGGIICVAPDIASAARGRLAPAAKISYVPNAIDTQRFALVSPERRRAARAALGLAHDATVLLHFGWDWTLKGGELFAAMLRNLRQRNERVVGLTVGGEPPDDVGGALRAVPPQDDVTAFYACADAFVSCSPAEGMPFAVLEALACGLTVVATDIPGHVALLDRADGCRLAPPGNSEAIAMAVVDALAAAPERRRQAALANRERIVREADVRPWATRLLDRYERLAGVAGEAAVA